MRSWQAGESKEMNWETEKRKRMLIRAMGRGKDTRNNILSGLSPPLSLPPSLNPLHRSLSLSPYCSVLPLPFLFLIPLLLPLPPCLPCSPSSYLHFSFSLISSLCPSSSTSPSLSPFLLPFQHIFIKWPPLCQTV